MLNHYRSLIVFIALVSLVATSGVIFEPGSWYADLDKPVGTPPNLVFPIVWTLLYLLIAMAGWLAWTSPSHPIKSQAFGCYGIQLLLNAAWSWVFFGQHWTVAGLINIVLLLVATGLNIRLFRPLSRPAAGLLIPYFIWVTYAAYLNAAIVWLN